MKTVAYNGPGTTCVTSLVHVSDGIELHWAMFFAQWKVIGPCNADSIEFHYHFLPTHLFHVLLTVQSY